MDDILGSKWINSDRQPQASKIKVDITTKRTRLKASVVYSVSRDPFMTTCCEIASFFPIANVKKAARVIILKPPTCISISITTLPKVEKYSAVFVTTRPVTQVAEVAVKRASIRRICSPVTVA